jgi:heme/copper-type cytochrome/quinol oxidase subunit 3
MAWWGTVGFAVIEGVVLVICVTSYFYLLRNFVAWPPLGTPLPSLAVPITGLVIMLLSLIPMAIAARYAKRLALKPMRIALAVSLIFKLAILVIRWFEFKAINTWWNSDAYGSILWITVGFHATLLLIDAAEDMGLLLILFLSSRAWERHFSDVTDDTLYWYFTVASWLPLFVIVYLLPRWI